MVENSITELEEKINQEQQRTENSKQDLVVINKKEVIYQECKERCTKLENWVETPVK